MAGYISKDFVHQGCGLILNPEKVWDFIPYSVRKNINKVTKNIVIIEKVNGSKDDIEILKSMWYDYNDPNMPRQLNESEFMFIAYSQKQEPIGAIILLPIGNHLFLNNLAGNSKGKSLGIQDYLLWHSVNYFKDSRFKYIDVGVSYRPMLYNFFKKWQTISYPVIFNKPEYSLKISDKPFNSSIYNNFNDEDETKTNDLLSSLFETEKISFVPDMKFAKIILENLGFEIADNTFSFTENKNPQPYIIDLSRLFSVQFGVLIINLEINNIDMWNKYHCLDVYKRKFVYSAIYNELNDFNSLIQKRWDNYKLFENYFLIEDIIPIENKNSILEYFYFEHSLNDRYHNKLIEFEIEHYYNTENFRVGLPINQNLSISQIEYIYAIFRGILNLCSEWEHTDNYKEIK